MERPSKDQPTVGGNIFYEKHKAYLGAIKYPLRYLEEENAMINPRQTDPKNINRLLNIFKLEGCYRLEPRNRVPVLISQAQYERLVDTLPDKDLDDSAKAALREEHENAGSFTDGDIYRHLRLKHLQNDLVGKRKWLARLSPAKRRDVLQLEKRAYLDDPTRAFNESLDNLLPYTGLWSALQLGFLDAKTVEILEGRCPKAAEVDFSSIKDRQWELLPYLSDRAERDQLWNRINTVEYTIPSIYTFLEDTKYLEPCAKVMKELLPLEAKASIRQTYERCYNDQIEVPIEVAEARFDNFTCKSAAISYRLAYLQIWLFAMRHFPVLTGHCPRKDVASAKPSTSRCDSVLRVNLYLLATKTGFENVNTRVESWDRACQEEAEKALAHFLPYPEYSIPVKKQELIARKIAYVVKGYKETVRRESSEILAEITTDDQSLDCGSHVNFRCGVPFEKTYIRDRMLLFLKTIYDSFVEIPVPRRYLSSFAIKSIMVQSFFSDCFPSGPDSVVPSSALVTAKGSSEAAISLSQPIEPVASTAPVAPHEMLDVEPSSSSLVTIKNPCEATTTPAPIESPQPVAPSVSTQTLPPTIALVSNEMPNLVPPSNSLVTVKNLCDAATTLSPAKHPQPVASSANDDQAAAIILHNPQQELVPYQDQSDFNTTLRTVEETIQIVEQWYNEEPPDKLVVVQESEHSFAISRITCDDRNSFERLVDSALAIHVPDRSKRLKTVSYAGSLEEKGLFCFQPEYCNNGVREALEKVIRHPLGQQRSDGHQQPNANPNDAGTEKRKR
ncbi:MAG: hypothetical protein Q9168_001722 [Polycauliona sp. 1 TL-2023]